ncbi:hypothetical protein D0Z07_3185 [Hyphodiscus hymeniophilus]|uniref:Uncharacterized protein n=1 Tax=Hyphodiscus hymeniophilus TaxID=353542 RepID=A0A9P6VL78_9HELO|nr:hypothetical protein D0Z07_3185 [Hyphodiscus hymeniophilus]
MSESAIAPVPQRDIRSAAKEFKRDRDAGEKWSMGTRPLPGVRMQYAGILGSEDWGALDDQQTKMEKVRPVKPWNNPLHKSHANKTPKPTNHYDSGINSNTASHRMVRKVDALVDANEHTSSPLSRSLLELLPQHANNTSASIQTAIRDHDSGILYSFDNAGVSPGMKGRAVGLDSLVDIAEKRWAMEQTEKIVKGEYEVLDAEGETTVLSGKKGKKGSPRQKAVKTMPTVVKHMDVEEDDGFELI